MDTATYTADVYISYAGNDPTDEYENSRDFIVKKICDLLEQQNLRAREYKRDVGYKESIEEYMLDIAKADYIILLISEKYLKSDYCMYEAIELLSRNKEGLKEKIFPVLLPDANIFDMDRHISYVDYWTKQFKEGQKKLKGKDPVNYASLFEKNKLFREIAENMDEFLRELSKMCQLSKAMILQNNFQAVVESILKQLSKNQVLATPKAAAMPVTTSDSSTPLPQTLTIGDTQDVTSHLKQATELISKAIGKVTEKVMDSETARKEFIDIHFEEISGEGGISPATLGFIYSLRTDKELYEPYRQSLIISALSLGLIRKYNEKKTRLLLDFATDDDPLLSNRALTGVVLGLLDKENYISDEAKRKLKTLRDNAKIQRGLLAIFLLIGNLEQLQKITEALSQIDYKKFEFFDSVQHWFQPFYEDNPLLKENVADKQLVKILLESKFFIGLDNLRYAFALLTPNLPKENIENIKKAASLDQYILGSIKTDSLREKFLLEAEIAKYVFEFYSYAVKNGDAALVNLIEDKENLRTGYLHKLVLNETTLTLLEASRCYLERKFNEAAATTKKILEDQPNNMDALILEASSHYASGSFEAAIPALEKVRTKGMEEPQLLAMLGDAYFNTKNYDKATDAYHALLSLQDNDAAWISIGRSHQLKENPDQEKALAAYRKVVEKAPDDYRSLLVMGDYYLNQQPPDYAAAMTWYEKAFNQNNSDINLIKAYATCLTNMQDPSIDKSEELFRRWMELEPQNVYPYLALGDCFANHNPPDLEKAFDLYYKGFELDPNNPGLIKFLDRFFEKYSPVELERARKIYEKFIELEPANTMAYIHCGSLFASHRPPDFEEAFRYCFRATEIENKAELIEIALDCAACMDTPPEEKIETLYKKYKELNPNITKPELAFADYHLRKKQPDYAKALNHYEKALTIDPTDQELLVKLGMYYHLLPQPDYETSVGYLNRALAANPEDGRAHFHHGWADLVTGNHASAKLHFEQSFAPGVDEGLVHQNLGHIAMCAGDVQKALEHYRKSIAFFETADAFHTACLSDFPYLEKCGLERKVFEETIEQVVKSANEKDADGGT
jgi:tetratricopeptide (TPR) repeat protein